MKISTRKMQVFKYLCTLFIMLLLAHESRVECGNLWNRILSHEKKTMKLRNLALTHLWVIYPDYIFKSSSPINLELTFNEKVTSSADILSVALVDDLTTPTFSRTMSIGSLKRGILQVSESTASIGQIGTYYLKIIKSDTTEIVSTGLTVTVKDDPKIIFWESDPTVICYNEAFSLKVTLTQPVAHDDVMPGFAYLEDTANSLQVPLTPDISKGNQLVLDSDNGTTHESDNYTFSITTNDNVLILPQAGVSPVKIGYGYQITAPTSVSIPANCKISSTLSFNKAIETGSISSASISGIGSFNVKNIDTNDNTKYYVEYTTGYSSAGTYATSFTDVCGKTFSGPSIIIGPQLAQPTLSTQVWEVNKTFSIVATFDRDIVAGEIASFKLILNTDTSVEVSPSTTSFSGSAFTANFAAIAAANDYTLEIKDWCGTTWTFDFIIANVPSITTVEERCFTKDSAFSFVVTYSIGVYQGQIKSPVTIGGVDFTLSTTFSDYSSSVTELTFATDTGISTVGQYTFACETVAGTVISAPGGQEINIFTIMTPTLSFTPLIWNTEVALTLTVTSTETMEDGQIKGIQIGDSITLTGFIQTTTGKVFEATHAGIPDADAGLYLVNLVDICNNLYSSTDQFNAVIQPTVSDFSPKCFLENTAFTTTVTFDQSIYPNQITNFKIGTGSVETTFEAITSAQSTLEITSTGASLGDHEITFTDMIPSTIVSSSKIQILSQLISITNVSPTLWDTGVEIPLDVTFNKVVEVLDIVTFTIKTDDSNIVTVTSPVKGSTNNLEGKATVTTPGEYVPALKDYCDYDLTLASPKIIIVTPPTVINITPLCFGPNTAITTTVTFDADIIDGYLKPLTAQLNSDPAQDFTFDPYGASPSVVAKQTGLSTNGDYILKLTSVADSDLPTTKKIKIGTFPAPAQISNLTPKVYNTNKAIVLEITTDRNTDVAGEITEVWLLKQGATVPVIGTISSVTGTSVKVTIPQLTNTDVGAYEVSVNDWCGNNIVGGAMNIVVQPTITAISPACYLRNSKIEALVTFSALLDNQLKSVSLTPVAGGTAVPMTLVSRVGNAQNIKLDAGVELGSYTVTFIDSSDDPIVSSFKLLSLSTIQPLPVSNFTPGVVYKAEKIVLTINFTLDLLEGQILSVTLKSSGSPVNADLITVSGKAATATFNNGVPEVGEYTLSGMDACGNAFTATTKFRAINKPNMTTFSPGCSVPGSAFKIDLNFKNNIIREEIQLVELKKSTATVPPYESLSFAEFSNAVKSLSLTSQGISSEGAYVIRLTDTTSGVQETTQTFTILSADTTPTSVEKVEPMALKSTDKLSLTIRFDKVFSSPDILKPIRLTDSNGNIQEVTIESSGEKFVVITNANFEFLDNKYKVSVGICNRVIPGPTIFITDIGDGGSGNDGDNDGDDDVPPVSPNPDGSDPDDVIPSLPIDQNGCLLGFVWNKSTKVCESCRDKSKFFYKGACVDKCPAKTYIYMDSICLDDCTQFKLVAYDGKCVGFCPDEWVSGKTGVCKNCRNLGLYYLEDDCVDECPGSYYLNEATLICTRYINIFEGKKYECTDDDPCNGGKCTKVFKDTIQCECPGNKTGMFCEKLKKRVNPESFNKLITTITKVNEVNDDIILVVMAADTLLKSFPKTVYTPEASKAITTHTKTLITGMIGKTVNNNVNILKFSNLAIHFKSKELQKLQEKIPRKLRNLGDVTLEGMAEYLILSKQLQMEIQELIDLTNAYVKEYVESKDDFTDIKDSIVFGNSFVSLQAAFNTRVSMDDFKKASFDNGLVPMDFEKCMNHIVTEKGLTWLKSLVIYKLEYSYFLNDFLYSDSNVNPYMNSNIIFYEIRNLETKENYDLAMCKEAPISIYFPLNPIQKEEVNLTEYLKYKQYGIDVFNKADPSFTSRCKIIGDKLDFDTTQSYRRNQVFQNRTVTCPSGDCQYAGFDDIWKYAVCECSKIDTAIGVKTKVDEFYFEPSSDVNLEVMSCPEIAWNNDIYKNAGFWISLFVLIGFVGVVVIHPALFKLIIENRDSRTASLKYDRIIRDNENAQLVKVKNQEDRLFELKPVGAPDKKDKVVLDSEENLNPVKKDNENADPNDVNLSIDEKRDNNVEGHYRQTSDQKLTVGENKTTLYDSQEKKSFWQIYKVLLFENHPVLTLFYHSVLCPFGLKISLFIFKFFMYFAINAFIFSDSYIQMRISDMTRHNFGYPMHKEFAKIIATIVITALVLIILRFASLPWPRNKKRLINQIGNSSDDQSQIEACNTFYNALFLRFVITLAVIGLLITFFFYYNVLFIAVYPQVTAGWIYSAIWCFILIWFAFSPFVILILTFIEFYAQRNKCMETCYNWTTFPLKFMF